MNTKKLSSKASNTHKKQKQAIKCASVDLHNKRRAKRTVWELFA